MSISGWAKVIKTVSGQAESLISQDDCHLSKNDLVKDMILAYLKFNITPKKYADTKIYALPTNEKKVKCDQLRDENKKGKQWSRLYHSNWRFLSRWSKMYYSGYSWLSYLRCRAYMKHYHLKNMPTVQYGVKIICEHQLCGTLEIGKHVLLAKECFIDYTGNVIIKDNVRVTYGVIIETHYHPYHADWQATYDPVQTEIIIEEGAVIGSRAIIMPTCHYIGKHARVGAGAVVTHDVPDYAIVVGAPAKVIRIQEH